MDIPARTSNNTNGSTIGSPPSHRMSSVPFASLENQKRSDDPQQMASRQSMRDQMQKPGIIGRWWNSFAYGITTSKNAGK